jgi:hypothetical protein
MTNLQIIVVPLVQALCKELSCDMIQLTDRINHPLFSLKAEMFLRGKKLRTTYSGLDGRRRDVYFSQLARKSAHQLYAYEGYLEVTVR